MSLRTMSVSDRYGPIVSDGVTAHAAAVVPPVVGLQFRHKRCNVVGDASRLVPMNGVAGILVNPEPRSLDAADQGLLFAERGDGLLATPQDQRRQLDLRELLRH